MTAHCLRTLLLAGSCLMANHLALAAQPAGTGIGAVLPAKATENPINADKPARRPPDELRQAPRRNRGAPAGVVAPPGQAKPAAKPRPAS